MAEEQEQSLPADDDPGAYLPLIELDALANQPPSWRKRLVQIGLVLGALVVVFATFWSVAKPPASPVPSAHVQPTQAPPTVLIVSNVNYGTITVNGKQQRGSPPLEVATSMQPPYDITLDAPPFQPLACRFPGCSASGFTIDPINPPAHFVSLILSPGNLPPNQRSQANSVVSQAISLHQAMEAPSGSYIITKLAPDGVMSSQQVSEPLYATVSLVPAAPANPSLLSCSGVICVSSVGEIVNIPVSIGHFWQISSMVALHWQFTTAAGAVVSEITFPLPEQMPLSLSYTAAAGWQIALPPVGENPNTEFVDVACQTGIEMLGVQRARYLSGGNWTTTLVRQQGAEGCELDLQQNNVEQGHFLWRFGVLLAADAKAHSTLPTLPLAPPAELVAVGG